MKEIVLQACLRKITSLDRSCIPDRIVVEFHLPLLDQSDIFGIDISRKWISERIAEPPSSFFEAGAVTPDRLKKRRLTEVMLDGDFLPVPRSLSQIGFARFASLADCDLIHMEYQWGSLCGAAALWRFDVGTNDLVGVRTLWVS
jgi:hypothetical protein